MFSRKVFFSSAGDTDDISTAALEVFLELSVCVGLGFCIKCEFHSQALHAHANADKNTRKMLHKNAKHFGAYLSIHAAFLCVCLYHIYLPAECMNTRTDVHTNILD